MNSDLSSEKPSSTTTKDHTSEKTEFARRSRLLPPIANLWRRLLLGFTSPAADDTLTGQEAKKRRWRLVQVESALECNLRCIMCPWKDFRAEARPHGIMGREIWESLRPHLDEIQSVDFTGGGEPLLQPRLAEWIAEAKSFGCETGVLTNGTLLNEEKARELISAGLNWICVSIDGSTKEEYEKIRQGASFEKVCANLANIAKLRTNDIPLIMINFVMMPANFHQVEDIVRLAAQLGADQVNFKQCEVIRSEHGKGRGLFGPRETKEIRLFQKSLARARGLAKKLKVRTTASSFAPREIPVCEQDPMDSVFISYEGKVAPCINLAYGGPTTFLGRDVNMPGVCYGKLPERDLIELWNDEACAAFRERFRGRVKAYREVFLNGLMKGSHLTPDRLLEEALKKMPKAPEGCTVCHYLHGI